MQRTLHEYPNRNRKLIYIFIWSLRWVIFFCFGFSFCHFSHPFSVALIPALTHSPVIFAQQNSLCVRFSVRCIFFIHWIAKASLNQMNTEFVFGRANKKFIVQSCKWKENKDTHRCARAGGRTDMCTAEKKSFQNARNHSQHKRYELQNKFKNRIKKQQQG